MENKNFQMEEFVYGKPCLSLIPRAFFYELLKEMQKIYINNNSQ